MYLIFIHEVRNMGREEGPYGGVDDFVFCDTQPPTLELITRLVAENAYRFNYATNTDKENLTTTSCVVGLLEVVSAVRNHAKRYASEVALADGVLEVVDTVPDMTNDWVDGQQWVYRHIPCLEALVAQPEPVVKFRIYYDTPSGEKLYFRYDTPCSWVPVSALFSTFEKESSVILEMAKKSNPLAEFEPFKVMTVERDNVHPDSQ